MKLKITLNTKLNRALFIGLIWCMIISISAFYFSENDRPKPNEQFYFITTEFDSSCLSDPYPTLLCLNKQVEMMPKSGSIGNVDGYVMKCDKSFLANRMKLSGSYPPLGSEYKKVELCNSALKNKKEYEIIDQHFRNTVDEMYSHYYFFYAGSLIGYILRGFAFWICIVFVTLSTRWINRGK